jgi:50S ribosomal protein L16 3-hydroxylase
VINFKDIELTDFLTNYWQKKPYVFRAALPGFVNPLTAEELAGLALEEEIESRLVFETPTRAPFWRLKRGPFQEKDFSALPDSHWTLLVQGVDRFVPEVASLLDYFDFLPYWRVDDVMISYAVEQGSVGPHYDNYDVFLYQAKGRRRWLLTTVGCVDSNYLSDLELRIMKEFQVEQDLILEEGDMLYLPPHVGHHGISLSQECMTYSFGYRSYQGQELWDSFGEYLASKPTSPLLYQDPIWAGLPNRAEIPREAWQQAKQVLLTLLEDENQLKRWFAGFATSLDHHAESLLPLEPEDSQDTIEEFQSQLTSSLGLVRNSLCRFAYLSLDEPPFLALYVNGCEWCTELVNPELVKLIAEHRSVNLTQLLPFLAPTDSTAHANVSFLYELWSLQWLEFIEHCAQENFS